MDFRPLISRKEQGWSRARTGTPINYNTLFRKLQIPGGGNRVFLRAKREFSVSEQKRRTASRLPFRFDSKNDSKNHVLCTIQVRMARRMAAIFSSAASGRSSCAAK